MNNRLSLFTHQLAKALGLLVVIGLFIRCDAAISHFYADPSKVHPNTGNQKTPLHIEAERGHKDQVKFLLLQGDDIDAVDNQGNTPLHLAALRRHGEVVKCLLQNLANVNAKDTKGRTPLRLAVEKHGDRGVVTTLLQSPDIDLEAKDNELGYTPLYMAASRGYAEAFMALLNKGANINAQGNVTQLTPLHAACFNGCRHEMVRILLQRGADVNAQDNHGQTPLHIVANKYMHKFVKVQTIILLQLLLKHGARMDIEDKYAHTPLHLAAENDRTEILETLLGQEGQVTITKQDHNGSSSLDRMEQEKD